MGRLTTWLLAVAALGVLWGGGCTPGRQPAGDTTFLPRPGDVGQWEPAGEVRTYDRDNLFDYRDFEAVRIGL